MAIVNKLNELISRGKPPIFEKTEYKKGEIVTNTTKNQKIKKYDYYICDYCGQEIVIEEKWENSNGGICELPKTITKGKTIILALHNRCINKAIQELKEQI